VALLLLVCAGCGKEDQTPASALEGHLDGADAESISGWVWDRNLPWPPSKVDIYDGETLLATVPANKFRQNLLDSGIGSGQHAFVYATPAQLTDGKAHTIRVTASGTTVELTGSPMTVTLSSGAAVRQELRYQELVKRIHEVVRTKLPPKATVLVVSDGDDDLLKLGDQRRGWHFPRNAVGDHNGEPANNKEAIAHLEALRAKGAGYLLLPAPSFWWLDHYKEFATYLESHAQRVHSSRECLIYQLSRSEKAKAEEVLPKVRGSLDVVNTDEIAGWAWDSQQPDAPVNVEIYEGSTLLTKRAADQFREDLRQAGAGNGKHGFSFPTPARLKDGRPHLIRVKIAGVEGELNGSSRKL
jgi:hypothetical protein